MAIGLVLRKLQAQSQKTQGMKGGHLVNFAVAKRAAAAGTLPSPLLAVAEQSVSSGCGTLFCFFGGRRSGSELISDIFPWAKIGTIPLLSARQNSTPVSFTVLLLILLLNTPPGNEPHTQKINRGTPISALDLAVLHNYQKQAIRNRRASLSD